MDRWQEALKAYGLESGRFVIPKKGTPEYEKVKAIFDSKRLAPPPKILGKGKAKKSTAQIEQKILEQLGEGTRLPGEGVLLAGEKPKRGRKPKA